LDLQPHQIAKIAEYQLAALAFAERLFSPTHLGKHWISDELGMDRPGYSHNETEAIAIIMREADKTGMELYQDLAGNAYMVYPGVDRQKPAVLIGSHLDAVKRGGPFDGPAGIVSALSAVKVLHDAKMDDAAFAPPQDICVAVWRCEESPRFEKFGIGSGIATGNADENILRRATREGQTLEELMIDTRFGDESQKAADMGKLKIKIAQRECLIPFEECIDSALEIHIEQYDTLLKARQKIPSLNLGIVNVIKGNVRVPRFSFRGTSQHSGTGTQDDRNDAGLKLIDFLALVKRGILYLEGGPKFLRWTRIWRKNDLVLTFPIFGTKNDNLTSTPALAETAFEVRSTDSNVLRKAEAILRRCAKKVLQANGEPYNEEDLRATKTEPVRLNEKLQSVFRKLAENLNITTMNLPSPAGHDIMNLAQYVRSVLIFICHNGISHDPKEKLGLNEFDNPYEIGKPFADAIKLAAAYMLTEKEPDPSSASKPKKPIGAALLNKGGSRIEMRDGNVIVCQPT